MSNTLKTCCTLCAAPGHDMYNCPMVNASNAHIAQAIINASNAHIAQASNNAAAQANHTATLPDQLLSKFGQLSPKQERALKELSGWKNQIEVMQARCRDMEKKLIEGEYRDEQ